MKLKLVTPDIPTEDNVLYITSDNFLAYKKNGIEVKLDKGGSERNRLIKCSDLKYILTKYMFKGSKYIINTYNPLLYYLIPGNSSNDPLFTSDNNFIPTIPTQTLIRGEVDGFDKNINLKYGDVDDPPSITTGSNGNWWIDGVDTRRKASEKKPKAYIGPDGNWWVDFSSVSQSDVRCIKACDNWYNNLSELGTIEAKIDSAISSVFSSYKNFDDLDIEKEVRDKVGGYSIDIVENSFTSSLTSETKYTDTLNLEDWIYASMKSSLDGISGKLDVSYMYSKGGVMYGGQQSIKIFRYEEYLTLESAIIDLGDVQLEFLDYVLKIYPLNNDVDEVIINDCTLTIGVL